MSSSTLQRHTMFVPQGQPEEVSQLYAKLMNRFWLEDSNNDDGHHHHLELGEASYKRALRANFPVREFTQMLSIDGSNVTTIHMTAGRPGSAPFQARITFEPTKLVDTTTTTTGTLISWESDFTPDVRSTGPLLTWLMQSKVFMPVVQHFSNLLEQQHQQEAKL